MALEDYSRRLVGRWMLFKDGHNCGLSAIMRGEVHTIHPSRIINLRAMLTKNADNDVIVEQIKQTSNRTWLKQPQNGGKRGPMHRGTTNPL